MAAASENVVDIFAAFFGGLFGGPLLRLFLWATEGFGVFLSPSKSSLPRIIKAR